MGDDAIAEVALYAAAEGYESAHAVRWSTGRGPFVVVMPVRQAAEYVQ